MPDVSVAARRQHDGAADATYVNAPFASALLELGHRHKDVVVLSADLAKYTDVMPFAEAFPDRFFQVGMAEQNMMGIAGGLAKVGFTPIAVTYGVFATRRAFDQIAMALGTGGRRAVVAAFLPGITTPFRATHQAIDDLAHMRVLPGAAVVDPADATELAAALGQVMTYEGLVYLRALRGSVKRLFDPAGFEFRLGEPRLLLSGGQHGVIGTGLGTDWALEAASLMKGAALLHVPTLKPLNRPAVADFCRGFQVVTTVENHSTTGGLASLVAEVIAEAGLATRVNPLGIPDRWAPAGSVEFIRGQLGLDAASIAKQAIGHVA